MQRQRRRPAPTTGVFQRGRVNAALGGPWDCDGFRALSHKMAGDALVEHAVDRPARNVFLAPICYHYRHALELALKELIRDAHRAADLAERCGVLTEEQRREVERLRTPSGGFVRGLLRRARGLLRRWSFPEARVIAEELRALTARLDALGPPDQGDGVHDRLHTHDLQALLNYALAWLRALRYPELADLERTLRAVITDFHVLDPRGESFRYARGTDGEPHIEKQLIADLVGVKEAVDRVFRQLRHADNYVLADLEQSEDYLSEVCSDG